MTIKPLDLMRRIVRGFSKPGDLVIDPFNGSGSTGAACLHEGRDYIGVELSEVFYEESLKRLKKLQAELKRA